MGNILALDIGGATTDFYSNVTDNPLYLFPGNDGARKVKRTILKTPNVPLVFRRVEGKYGLAYNSENLKELARFKKGTLAQEMGSYLTERFPGEFRPGTGQFTQFLSQRNGSIEIDLNGYLTWISQNPHKTPENILENAANSYLAKEIMAIATGTHVGFVKETETYFLQHGVNYFNQDVTVILIGGTIYHACRDRKPGYKEDLALIASGVLYNPNEENLLRPNGKVLLDASYLVSILGGLYGKVYPEQALRVMKRELLSFDTNGWQNEAALTGEVKQEKKTLSSTN
jgi:hypothetical protein